MVRSHGALSRESTMQSRWQMAWPLLWPHGEDQNHLQSTLTEMGMGTSKKSVCQSNCDSERHWGHIAAGSVFNRFRLTGPELWSFSNCPFCVAEAAQQIARFMALLKKIENTMSSILGPRGWQGLGHPRACRGWTPCLQPKFAQPRADFWTQKIKCKCVPGPRSSAGSGYGKGVRCPINVCRIIKWLKRERGRKEGRREGKKWCLRVVRTMYSNSRLLPPWLIWYRFPLLCIFIAYGFLWTWSIGRKVNETQTYYSVLNKL